MQKLKKVGVKIKRVENQKHLFKKVHQDKKIPLYIYRQYLPNPLKIKKVLNKNYLKVSIIQRKGEKVKILKKKRAIKKKIQKYK